jgi:integrase
VPVKKSGFEGVYYSVNKSGRVYEARCPRTQRFVIAGPTADDARNLRARLLMQHVSREVTGNPDTRVAEVIEKWRSNHAPLVKATSLRTYERVVRTHIEPRWSRTKVKDITRAAVSAWLATDVPAGSARLIRATFTVVMEQAVEERMIGVNPVKGAKLPRREEKVEKYALTPAELDRLISRCPQWLRPVVEVAYSQALRLGEVTGLRWSDIDFERGEMTVATQEYRDETTGTTKGNKAKTIVLTEQARKVLIRQRLARGGDDPVFAQNYRSIEEGFRRVVKAAEPFGGRVSFHTLRHTRISVLAQSQPLAHVSRFARHASISQTAAYVHVIEDEAVNDAIRRAA